MSRNPWIPAVLACLVAMAAIGRAAAVPTEASASPRGALVSAIEIRAGMSLAPEEGGLGLAQRRIEELFDRSFTRFDSRECTITISKNYFQVIVVDDDPAYLTVLDFFCYFIEIKPIWLRGCAAKLKDQDGNYQDQDEQDQRITASR